MNKLVFILFLVFCIAELDAQKAYYLSDSNAFYGVEIADMGLYRNNRYGHLNKNGEIVNLSPESITEYGLEDGRVYVSKVIPGSNPPRKYFLELLVDDTLKLYKFKSESGKIFYIEEEDSILTPLLKKSFFDDGYKEELQKSVISCPEVGESLKYVKYNSRTLKAFVNQYNNCDKAYFPLFTWGLFVAFEYSSYVPKPYEEDLLNIEFNYHRQINYGAVVDIPLLYDKAFFSTGLMFGKKSYRTSIKESNKGLALVIDQETFRLPFIFKLTTHSLNVRPYIFMGAAYKYLLYNNSLLLEATSYPDSQPYENEQFNVTEIKIINNQVLKKQTAEVIGGVGVAKQLSVKRSIFIELRYMQELDFSRSDHLNMRGFTIVGGINL